MEQSLSVEWVEPGRLHPNPANPRVNDGAVPHVAASLSRFGWQQPIVARSSGEIVAGHTRLKAAEKLGMEQVPVLWFQGSDLDAAAYNVADNRTHEFSSWDDGSLAGILTAHRRDLAIAGLGAEAGQELPLGELLQTYLEDLRPRVTDGHYRNVASRLRWVVNQLGEARVRDINQMDLVRIRNSLVTAGRSNRTANLTLDRLRAMLNWAVDAGAIAQNPVARLKSLPTTEEHQRYRRRALTEGEIERFLAASEVDDEQCQLIWDYVRVPQTPLWRAFLETGARYGELRQVSWGDVDFSQSTLALRAETTKSRKLRVIPLRQGLVNRLRHLRVIHESVHGRLPNVSDCVFLSPEGVPYKRPSTNVNRILRRLLDAAGIARIGTDGRKVDVHGMRHTFASRLARNGVGLVQAQRLMGHSDPKLTSQVYSHVEADDLREAVEGLPSLAEGSRPRNASSG